MVNGLTPWGNHQILPLGPLREPLKALGRADVVVIHHANLVPTTDFFIVCRCFLNYVSFKILLFLML
jgi:tetraacyldisaccharide-1-P 4'-kinase